MEQEQLNAKSLSFAVFMIYKLAKAWNELPAEVYDILVQTQIFDGYLIGFYDCLHTLGGEYLTQDITEMARERGAKV